MKRLCAAAVLLGVANAWRKGRGVVVAVTGATKYMDEAAANLEAFRGGGNVSIVLPDDNAELASACQHYNKKIGWHCVPVSRRRLVETLFVNASLRSRATAGLAALSAAMKAGTVKKEHAAKIQGRVYHIAARLATPYHDTIFLDADVYPCLTLDRIWHKLDANTPGRSLLDVYDVLGAHESNSITRKKGVYHPHHAHGERPGHLVPPAWPEINGGVMVFRRNDRSTEFFENWLTRYVEDNRAVKFDISKTGSLGGQDQPTLRHALYDAVLAGMRFYALPPIWNTRAWKPNLQGIDYRHKSQAETNCCFDPTIIDVARDESSGGGLPRKEVSIILDHKCSLPAAIADHEGGPRYFPHGEYGREKERYPKKLPHHLR